MLAINSKRKHQKLAVVAHVLQNTRNTVQSFHVVVSQTARKCRMIYNARVQPFLCSLSLLFGDVLVAVAVVVYLSSLMAAVATGNTFSSLGILWLRVSMGLTVGRRTTNAFVVRYKF